LATAAGLGYYFGSSKSTVKTDTPTVTVSPTPLITISPIEGMMIFTSSQYRVSFNYPSSMGVVTVAESNNSIEPRTPAYEALTFSNSSIFPI